MGQMKDLTGKTFGKLTVLENAGKLDGRRYYWKCQCECGTIKNILGSSLSSGNTKSCGCGKSKGLKQYNLEQSEKAKISIGTKFGKLTVIEDLGFKGLEDGHSRRWYKCQCDCGNIKEININRLKTGNTMSCGQCNFSSKGEYLIDTLLKENGNFYLYDTIYTPLVVETGRKLRFDFIIYEDENYTHPIRFIEFDGRQHSQGPDTIYWGRTTDTLETIKERDEIKNKFCLSHDLTLVRIPYSKKEITLEDIFGDKYIIKE